MAVVRKRGISEKVVYAYNPLPQVEDKELHKLAGFKFRKPSKLSPFEMRWQYDGGLRKEIVTIAPGDMLPLRESEAKDIYKELGDLGLALLDDPDNDDEVRQATLDGIARAREFYAERGQVVVNQVQQTHMYSEEQMNLIREKDLWSFHYNEAKAQFLGNVLQSL